MSSLSSEAIACLLHDALEVYESAASQAEFARLLNRGGIHYGSSGYFTIEDVKRALNWEKRHQGKLPSDPPPNVKHRPYHITYLGEAYRLVMSHQDPAKSAAVADDVYGGVAKMFSRANALYTSSANLLDALADKVPTLREEREARRYARNARRVVEDAEDFLEDIKERRAI